MNPLDRPSFVRALAAACLAGAPVAASPLAGAGLQDPAGAPPACSDDVAKVAAEDRVELLGLAYDAASKMPLVPHVKTRSKLQVEVVEALLSAGGSPVAIEWADGIENWRGAFAHALIASHYAQEGDLERARAELGAAEGLEVELTGEDDQGWRRDRVRIRIAEAYYHLGDVDAAAAIQTMVDPSEAGHLAVVASKLVDEETIDRQFPVLNGIAENGSFEETYAALQAITHFYGRLYAKPDRRTQMESAVREAWDPLPGPLRMKLLETMARYDLENGEKKVALSKIEEIETYSTKAKSQPELEVEYRATVARLYGEAGQRDQGIRVADDALTHYDLIREEMPQIFRGQALRPLATAYTRLGEPMTANDLYERGIVEIASNPNARPRVNDLVATCISIVDSGLEPRESLVQALRELSEGLRDPW